MWIKYVILTEAQTCLAMTQIFTMYYFTFTWNYILIWNCHLPLYHILCNDLIKKFKFIFIYSHCSPMSSSPMIGRTFVKGQGGSALIPKTVLRMSRDGVPNNQRFVLIKNYLFKNALKMCLFSIWMFLPK